MTKNISTSSKKQNHKLTQKTVELQDLAIQGAREHNLKNVSLRIPKRKLIVFTGVSGSGKSSMAFDTIYAEGQRRYVESLSAYARQFIGQMEKPKYDSIRGLSPTISIEQKAASKNPRSTVGTITEIYDYLRVLYARMGMQTCIVCQKKVGQGNKDFIIDVLYSLPQGSKLILFAPLVQNRKGEFRDLFADLRSQGLTRARIDGLLTELTETISLQKNKKHTIDAVIDRLATKQTDEFRSRLADSVETALKFGEGALSVQVQDTRGQDASEELTFNLNRSCCGIAYPALEPTLFSFNSPSGMCESCNGLGTVAAMDEERLLPDPKLSLAQGAVVPWQGYFEDGKIKRQSWGGAMLHAFAGKAGVDLDKPWNKLPKKQRDLILYGDTSLDLKVKWDGEKTSGTWSTHFEGVIPMMWRRYKQTQSEMQKTYYQKFMSTAKCSACNGRRLKETVLGVLFREWNIHAMCERNIEDLHEFFSTLRLSGNETIIGSELIKEIRSRLQFLVNVGLSYLTLNRKGPTLSGGEAQRIRLASQIGSELTGVLYILDEPSIGLHQRDNQKLIQTLEHLRDIGNTLIVVEHDLDTIKAADHIVDFGPGAGNLGGKIVAQGSLDDILRSPHSLTGAYMSGRRAIEVPELRRSVDDKKTLQILGVRENNLKGVDFSIPLGVMVAITGVSGAGKSTLINQVLYPALARQLGLECEKPGHFEEMKGYESIDKIINIDQKPIGRTPRSNPATYTKVFDHIRDFFAELPESKLRGYAKGRYSFNVAGGRCDSCQGDGFVKVEMHFLADVFVPCESCQGKRFNSQTLEVKFKGNSISDVLGMSVLQARELFERFSHITHILDTLIEVGLGYIALGQSATTLSGGEAQRIKLARELARKDTGQSLYILDEPTTGLHFEDMRKLLSVLQKLVDRSNTVLVIEHNLDVIKTADWIIDMGPDGGDRGGQIVAVGTPEDVARQWKQSYTGQFLRDYLKETGLKESGLQKSSPQRSAPGKIGKSKSSKDKKHAEKQIWGSKRAPRKEGAASAL